MLESQREKASLAEEGAVV